MVCIVDESGSVGATNFKRVKDFLKDVVDELEIGPHAFELGFVKFDSSATAEFNIGNHSDAERLKVTYRSA